MDDPDSRVDGVDAAEETLFDVLGNATRLRILRQLLEAAGPGTDREALAFSELYDRVDYDTSANFSYHVDQLIDAGLVTRDDRGYAPSLLGTMLARKLLAGWTLLNPDEALDPTPIGAGCPRCGTAVALSYYGGVMRVHCPRCAETVDAERDRAHRSGDHPSPPPFLGMSVPPARLAGRDAEGMFR
ncbi:MAG: helix-turn-helix domain-containing protein, partial [Candidatus Nanohaloarchaea archaeon]